MGRMLGLGRWRRCHARDLLALGRQRVDGVVRITASTNQVERQG